MKTELELIKFLKTEKDWAKKLSSHPYNLKFDKYKNLILFKYSQIDSKFNYKLVRESRGIIINIDTIEVVCYPFNKFFNYGETLADDIDFNSSRIQSKIDGSLIKLFYYKNENRWIFSTNGKILAEEAELNNNISNYKTFKDLIDNAINRKDIVLDKLNETYTYMFELVSPFNKIVVYYPETKLYHIGTRNNNTYEELDVDIGIEKPKEYHYNNLNEILDAVKDLPSDEEGYVVVDKYYNRIKIKSPKYLLAHRMVNNGNLTVDRAIQIIEENEVDEFLSYFPEWTDYFNSIADDINYYKNKIKLAFKDVDYSCFVNRKDFADFVLTKYKDISSLLFMYYDNKINSINDIDIKVLTRLVKKKREK